MSHRAKRILTLLLAFVFVVTMVLPTAAVTYVPGSGISNLELGKTVIDPGYGAGDERIVTVQLTIHGTIPEGSEASYAGYKAEVKDVVPKEFGLPYDFMIQFGTGTFEDDSDYVVVTPDLEAGTHVIDWYVGEVYEDGITLQYKIKANAPYYGAILTNTQAQFMVDLEGTEDEALEGPFDFPNPYAKIRPYAVADNYQASLEVALAVTAGNGLLANDLQSGNNDFINDVDDLWDIDSLTVKTASIKLPAAVPTDTYELDVDEDGSFTFLAKEGFSGDTFTFQYQTMVNVASSNDVSAMETMMMHSDFVDVVIEVDASTTPPPSPDPSPTPVTTPATPATLVPLIVNVVGPGTALPGSNSYSQNSLVVFTVTPEEGASFLGWTGPDGADVTDDRILMSGAREVTANFGTPPVPELEPEPEVIPPEPIPEAVPETDDVILDEEVPLDVPALPTTSGLPLGLVSLTGGLMIAAGMARRRNK